MNSKKSVCTIVILTDNCGKTLPRLLASLRGFAEIIVLDGGSTDGTLDIARAAGCRILPQRDDGVTGVSLEDFSAARNRGLRAAREPWFFFIDSDETASPELVEEIRKITETESTPQVFEVPRKYIMNGKVIEYSITYPAAQMRFFHRDAVEKFIKPVHERPLPHSGVKISRLKNSILVPQENIFFLRKWFRYMTIEAKKYKNFSISKCLLITFRRLGVAFLYTSRYLKILVLNKKPRAPWRHEFSYILYNFVHIFYMWRAKLI